MSASLPTTDAISTDYTVEGDSITVDVEYNDASYNQSYSGNVTASVGSTGESADLSFFSSSFAGDPSDSATFDLTTLGVPEGQRTEVLFTTVIEGNDGTIQQQEEVAVTWGAAPIDVEILNAEQDGATLEVAVSVSTESTQTIDYELNINDTGTGGSVTRSGQLAGGAGSFPGDANIENASFEIGDTAGGTVTAVITGPDALVSAENQDQVEWGDSGGGGGNGGDVSVELTNCDSTATSGGDLNVSYTLAPTGSTGGDVGVTVRVNGQEVGSEEHYVPPRGGAFSQTIPGGDLPIGSNMPVEIGVSGNFSDCGTVTTEADDPAPEPPEPEPPEPADPQITDCGIESEDPLRVGFSVDGQGERGETTAQLRVGGFVVAEKQVNYTLNPIDHTIEAPTEDLPVGDGMSVSVSLSGS